MSSLTIITISNGDLSELLKTLDSIDYQIKKPFQNIVVASNIDDDKKNIIKKSYSKNYRLFFLNIDTSLYNAMNIGIKNATGTNIIFINSGDFLFSKESVQLIYKKITNSYKKCHAFRIAQYFKDDIYIRPGMKNTSNWGHAGFVVPLESDPRNRILFDENKLIVADSYWMKSNKKKYGISTHIDVITRFKLGGISNNPSRKSIFIHMRNGSIKSFSKEIFKFILIKSFGRKRFYHFIGYINKYDRIIY